MRVGTSGFATALGALACLAAAAAPARVAGQAAVPGAEIPPPVVVMGGGLSRYNLHGTGTAPLVSLGVELPMSRSLVLEPSLAWSAGTRPEGPAAPSVVFEVQAQLQRPMGSVVPYLGGGAGGFFDLREEREGGEWVVETFSAAAGARYLLPGGSWTVRGEIRIRRVDGFSRGGTEGTLGVGRAF